MGSYTQTNGGSTPVSTGGKGTSMSLPPAWAHNAPRAGFGDDYGNSPRPTSPTYDPTGGGPAATSLPQGYQPLPSQGGKGSSQTVGGMSPPPDVAARYGGPQQQILTALRSLFQPRQQQPSYQYQAPTYAQMQQQALPQGWQSPQAPPTPPPAAPAPAADTERRMAEMQARINQLTEQRSQIYDPYPGATMTTGFKRGGAVPTEAQKHAGNYKKDHVSFQGLPISIENPKGSTREGKDPNGKEWRCVMPADYGYVKRTEGADGDHVDVFIGPDKASKIVFVINQNDHRTGQFDEHKVMLGYSSERQAVADYMKAFNDGKGADRIGSVEPMSLNAFKHWLKRGRTKTPAKSKSIVEHALAVTRSKK